MPALRDRVAQMALKLVMEPIFEPGFYTSSYAYRPGRRAQDAIAEIHLFTTRTYKWIVETDIEACLEPSSHCQRVHGGGVEQGVFGLWDQYS
jgi:RNA-directed DNA polymerase